MKKPRCIDFKSGTGHTRKICAVLAGMVLLSLGLTSCSSLQKLDLSAIDSSQPVEVGSIYLFAYSSSSGLNSAAFFEKYGENLKSEPLEQADADTLLELLCGAASTNWESIVERVKTETGLTLSGDQFMTDMESGDSRRITSQIGSVGFGTTRYFYSWNIIDQVSPTALIGLSFDSSTGTIVPNKIQIQTGDWDEFGTASNIRDYTLQLR
ncbi:MAG: hypothetical protein LBI67_07005 [Treponema sp.]|jgi:hypothetical protein|nr:hypothetical protein [Treponema sp.]